MPQPIRKRPRKREVVQVYFVGPQQLSLFQDFKRLAIEYGLGRSQMARVIFLAGLREVEKDFFMTMEKPTKKGVNHGKSTK